MKHIVLFGAGKSATVLISYLQALVIEKEWWVTVADADLKAVYEKTGEHPRVKGVGLDIHDAARRRELIASSDIVISLMPPGMHYLIALDCPENDKHLLTASYVDEKIRKLHSQVAGKGLIFLCEMGLDPGIDHMSAMQLINRIKAAGGKIHTFKSHCGGLVAPESDDNPWHYKISWNPRNVVLAGKNGAVYKEDGFERIKPYEELFATTGTIEVPGIEPMAYYPNRDSLAYIPVYHLEEASTFIRTTIRHPEFCFGWKNLIDLKLTEESETYNTEGMTLSEFFRVHFEKHGFAQWITDMLSTRLSFAKDVMKNLLQLIDEEETDVAGEDPNETIMLVNENGELDTMDLDDVKDKAAEEVANKMHEANLSLKQLFFLGLDSDQLINKGVCTPADILQYVLQEKLSLGATDKDMVVMMHELGYELDGVNMHLKSSLVVKGEDHIHTAMAKTVGLPLGIAARLILEGVITQTGVNIPVSEAIYKPVLGELEKFGITFNETVE